MVGGFCSYFEPATVLCTAISTLAMLVGLTMTAAFMNNESVNILAGALISLAFVSIPVIIFSLVFRNLLIYMIVQGICVVLTSFYIIFDTHLIMTRVSYDDYIIAALMLYIDIINLFIHLLSIFGSMN